MFTKFLPCYTPQVVEEKKELVPESVEKKLIVNKPFVSCTKEGDKVHQDAIMMKDDFKPDKPIMLRSAKLRFHLRGKKKKCSGLWFIKEVRDDGTIELESPYSRRTKSCNHEVVAIKGSSTLREIGVKLDYVKQVLTRRQPNPHFSFMLFCYLCFDFTFQKSCFLAGILAQASPISHKRVERQKMGVLSGDISLKRV